LYRIWEIKKKLRKPIIKLIINNNRITPKYFNIEILEFFLYLFQQKVIIVNNTGSMANKAKILLPGL